MAKKKGSKKKSGVEVFDDFNPDEIADEVSEIAELEQEEELASAISKAAKSREEEKMSAIEEEDELEEVDEEDGEELDKIPGFDPWIYTATSEWELEEVFKDADDGVDVIIYDVENKRWYKMTPITVGEVPVGS